MKLVNEIIEDYSDHCERILRREFTDYPSIACDPIYLHERYLCRIIQPKKRAVLEANNLVIPALYSNSYGNIKSDIELGNNLAKYQSRKLKELDYDDDMLSHWKIHHFHLDTTIDSDGFVSRTCDLLFLHFSDIACHILGVFDHSSWCDIDLIETIHQNWPSALAACKLNSSSNPLREEEYKILRANKMCASVVTQDGTEYISPGLGVLSNGAPLFSVLNSQNTIYTIVQDFKYISDNIDQILCDCTVSRKKDVLTIGLDVEEGSGEMNYVVKETGLKFRLNKLAKT